VLPGSGIQVRIRLISLDAQAGPVCPAGGETLLLCAESITLPLIVRSWTPGDRIRPIGCSADKKVKSVFADHRVPVRLRHRLPVLECGGTIISVGTLCMADHCRITPDCRKMIDLTIAFPDQA